MIRIRHISLVNRRISALTVPGIVFTMTGIRRIFVGLLLMGFANCLEAQTQTFTTFGSFTVPAGVTSLTVQCWGGGGGGSTITSNNRRGGGGGGGAYASSVLTVTPGTLCAVVVGAGGAANTAGGSSTFNANSVIAAGGTGGTSNSTVPGAGGTFANSTGTVRYAGGNGAAGGGTYSGGGGGGAGTTGVGGNAPTAALGSFGIGTALYGGNGGASVSVNTNGNNGSNNVDNYGGGGSGASRTSGTVIGGTGAKGYVIVSWTCPTYNLSATTVAYSVCTGSASTVTLTSAPAGLPVGTYTVTYNLGAPNAATGSTSPMTVTTAGTGTFTTSNLINPGTTSVTVTFLTSGSGTGSGTLNCTIPISSNNTANITVITVPAQPSAISGNTTPCQGSSQIFSVTNVVGVTYNWVFPTGWTPTSGGNTNSVTVTVGATSGNVTVIPLNSCGNGPASILSVTSTTIPAQPTITGTGTPCIGSTQTYSVTPVTGVSYNWEYPSDWTLISEQGTNSITFTVGATAGNVTVTPTNSCGPGTPRTLGVTINTIPSAAVATATPALLCEGTTLTLTGSAAGATAWSWSGPNSYSSSSQNPTITNITTAGTGSYTLTASNTCGTATPVSTASVIVNQSPLHEDVITTTCSGSSPNYSLTASMPSTFSWTIPITGSITGASAGSGSLINQTLTNPSNSVTGSVVYHVTPTSTTNSCAGPPFDILVLVEPLPVVTPILNATYCSGSVVPATNFLSSTGGGSFVWTSSQDIGFGTIGTGNIPAFSAQNIGSTPVTATISVRATSGGNCLGPQTTFQQITVNPSPDASITADYCSSPGNIGLTASPAGLTYLWNTGAATRLITVQIADAYSVKVTNSYTCSETAFLTVATELVTDGSFTNFNAVTPAFFTKYQKNQAYYSGGATGLWLEGTYAVNTSAYSAYPSNPQGYHPKFHGRDHTNNTTGSKNFMMVNGIVTAGQIIWQQTISVQTNTAYYFSAWGMNLNPDSPARLQFEVNGIPVGTTAELNIAPKPTSESQVALSNWVRFYSNPTWNSDTATTAVIRIINLNTVAGGNDFGLDDISFGSLSSAQSTFTPLANGGAPVCQGSELALTANITNGIPPYSYLWSGPNGFPSTDQNPVLSNVSSLAAGSYTLHLTDGHNCTVSKSVDVTVNDLPTAVLSGSGSVCNGSSATLSVALTGSQPWSVTYANGSTQVIVNSISTSPYTFSVTPATTATYNIISVSDKNCTGTSSGSAIVTVTAPAAPTATSNPICAGTTATITASGAVAGENYHWYTTSSGVTPVFTGNPFTTPVLNVPTAYYVAVFNTTSNCESARISVDVDVKPLPVAPGPITSRRNSYCKGAISGPYSITSSPNISGATYQWFQDVPCGGTTWTGSGSSTYSINLLSPPTVTTTFSVRTVSSNGCGFSACTSITITVDQPPVITGTLGVCAGSTTQLTGSGAPASTSPWVSGTPGVATVSNTGVVSGVSAGSSVITYTNSNGCIKTATVTVTAPPVITPIPDQRDCKGNGVDFTAVYSAAGSVNYQWQSSADGGASWNPYGSQGSSSSSPIILSLSNVGVNDLNMNQTKYQLIITDGNGCSATSNSAILTVNSITAITGSTTSTLCEGQNISFTASTAGVSPISFQWIKHTSSGVWSDVPGATTQTISFANITIAEAGEYKVRAIFSITVPNNNNSTTCTETNDDITRILIVNPLSTVTPGGPNSICQSAAPLPMALTGATVGGSATTGAWSITSGGGSLSSLNQTASPETVTYTPQANYTGAVTLMLTTNGPCGAVSATITITINQLPTTSAIYHQ